MTSTSERWIRSQRAAVADVGSYVYLVARDGVVRRVEGDSAELARAVLAYLGQPHSDAEVVDHVESLSGPLGERRPIVAQLVALLAEVGAIVRVPGPSDGPRASVRPANIVVAVSGAIAATHAPAFVAALQRRGHAVEVALTPAAQRFVAVDALAAIAGREIHTTLWPRAPHAPVPHVALAQWADLVVVYPASATTIGRIAHGDFSDLVSAIALTTRAPVVLAPSMNTGMLASAAVQRNLDQLRDDGVVVVHGVPSQEVVDAPSVRANLAEVAPAPGELAAMIDSLRAAGVLSSRSIVPSSARVATSASDWDAIYRTALVPWVRATCDDDIAEVLASYGRPGARVLDIGTGHGQIARHAAALGCHVVATDLSEVALRAAVDASRSSIVGVPPITWLRDDICATSLAGTFDVIVDRATLHTLPASRVHAWAVSVTRLVHPGGVVIVKAHRGGVPGVTTAWSASALADRLPDFEVVSERDAELPGLTDATPIPSVLVVLRRHQAATRQPVSAEV